MHKYYDFLSVFSEYINDYVQLIEMPDSSLIILHTGCIASISSAV